MGTPCPIALEASLICKLRTERACFVPTLSGATLPPSDLCSSKNILPSSSCRTPRQEQCIMSMLRN
eukprot:1965796-Pyramimonas_sp.AAC.1